MGKYRVKDEVQTNNPSITGDNAWVKYFDDVLAHDNQQCIKKIDTKSKKKKQTNEALSKLLKGNVTDKNSHTASATILAKLSGRTETVDELYKVVNPSKKETEKYKAQRNLVKMSMVTQLLSIGNRNGKKKIRADIKKNKREAAAESVDTSQDSVEIVVSHDDIIEYMIESTQRPK